MILTVVSAPIDVLAGGKVDLESGVHLLGKDGGCKIQLFHDSVSHHHARLTISADGSMLLEDLGSTNGSWIDGVALTRPSALLPNQTITLGAVDLTVQQLVVKQISRDDSDLDATLQSSRLVSTTPEDALRDLPAELALASRYEIKRHIAQGGMGAVLGARQPAIRREVAMKVMLGGADAASRMRFIEEAQITGQLEHPNIVPVHDLAIDEQGQPFYTMKLVKGINLHEVIESLREGKPDALARYPLPVLLTVFQKVCDALAFAHSHGVIHRDLKPANIMLGDFGEVLVMDWGLAKLIQARTPAAEVARKAAAIPAAASPAVTSARGDQSDTYATMAGYVMGTPQFMSPEQISGDPAALDARSDVFALGAILYSLITLQPPFTGKDVPEVLERIQTGRFSHPQALDGSTLRHLRGGRVPDSLKAVVRKALATQPCQRYQNVAGLQSDLAAYQGGFATRAENAGTWRQFRLLIQRNKAASIGLAAVLVIGGTLGTKAIVEGRRAEQALADLKKSAPAFAAEADSLLLKGDVDGALTRLGTAIQLDGENPRWHARQGQILDASLHFPEAAAAYTRAESLDPAGSWKEARVVSEKIASARQPDGSYPTALLHELYSQSVREGRSGDALLLSTPLKLAGKEALPIWQAKVDAWLGKNAPKLKLSADGTYSLELTRLGITDLTPLKGMPLSYLGLGYNKVSDLTPLEGMPLRNINIERTAVSELSPLAGASLTHIMLADAPVSDLSPLRGMPLSSISAQTRSLADISPLSDSPLSSWLRFEGSRITDISPLAGKQITELWLADLPIEDFSVLRGMPLKRLHIGNSALSPDLVEIVMGLDRLETLSISPSVSGFERLRSHPTLKYLGHSPNDFLRYPPVADYWRAYDERTAQAQKSALLKLDVRRLGNGTKRLALSDPALAAIPPLDWTNVSVFVFSGTRISDLSPLRGLNLKFITFLKTPVADLEPLRGSPVVKLAFMETAVSDVSALLDCPNLESVVLSRTVKNVEVLRKHPKLKYIGYTEGPGPDYLPETTAEEFWRIYDVKWNSEE